MPPKKAAALGPAKTKKKTILWDRDGVDGGESSIEIILEWLSTGNNYDRWRGDKQKGTTKTRLCSEIIHILKSKGIHHRDNKGVRQKIGDLQSSYNTARDFLKNTGEGIMATDELNGINTVEERINELCRYWDILDPIMSSRSVTEPLHIRSSLGGDQPRQPHSPDDEDDPSNPSILDQNTRADLPSETLDLPEQLSLSPRLPVPTLPNSARVSTPRLSSGKKKTKAKSSSVRPRPSSQGSRRKKVTTEDLYMKSIVSKRQAEVTRARAEASKIKVAYMKELREHGLSLAEIEMKASIEFPPLADMDNNEGNDSNDDSDDST